MSASILTLNAGSSSLKFALYQSEPAAEDGLVERARGQVDAVGGDARLRVRGFGADGEAATAVEAPDHATALRRALAWLTARVDGPPVAVGHRVVHGGPDLTAPVRATPDMRARLRAFASLAPLHQPHNLAGVDAAAAALPDAAQVACFDTAFHRAHPWVADTFALPRVYYDEGVRRYGFHGLSYESISSRLAAIEPDLHAGRVIIAHLGNGASMCAVKEGRSLGSTMGFTALDGLPMGTRCGQIDPGLVLWLITERGMTPEAVQTLLYMESGLKGLSGLSHDMRVLEASDAEAAEGAIAYFTHRIKRDIGAMAAILEGVDAIVFTGGIGENSARVRETVCAGLGWLGVAIDPAANAAHRDDLTAAGAAVRVLRLATDEERVIARAALAVAVEDGRAAG